MLFFGGWANRWLGDLYSLDVSGIVGPSYAATGVRPIMGPLSGGRPVTVLGINFVQASKIDVKFTNGDSEEIVSGTFVSKTEILCESPSFDKYGAGEIDVKVLIGAEIFTVNRVKYTYYNDTKATSCIAYGPGLTAVRSYGTPASFVLQAKDTKGKNRTSGDDDFDVKMITGSGKEEETYVGTVKDILDGTYICTYIPPAPGDYLVHVTLDGDHIRGSPFPVKCTDPWKKPRIQGVGIKVEDQRSVVTRNDGVAGGLLMSYVQGSSGVDTKDGIAVFDSSTMEWQNAVITGSAPAKVDNAAITRFADTMVTVGGSTYSENGPVCNSNVAVLQKEKHANSWAWNAPTVAGVEISPRENANAVHLMDSKILVTGGEGLEQEELDVQLLNVESPAVCEWMAHEVSADGAMPVNRCLHGSVSNKEGQVFLFGGKALAPRDWEEKRLLAEQEAAAAAEAEAVAEAEAANAEAAAEENAEADEAAAEPDAEAAAEEAETGEAEAEAAAAAEPAAEGAEGAEAAEAGADAEGAVAEAEEEEPEGDWLLNDMVMVSVDDKDGKIVVTKLEPSGPTPEPRVNAQMEMMEGKMLMYGGEDLEGNALCDMHLYCPEENSWRCVWQSKPPPANKPTKVFFDAGAKQLMVLDGTSGTFDAVEVLDLGPLLEKGDDLISDMTLDADKTLQDLEDFINKEGLALDTKVEEGDLDRLLKVMGALHDILSQQDMLDLRMDSLSESVEFLVEQEIDISSQQARLSTMKVDWNAIKKRAPKIKAGIRTFQEREGRKIKHEITKFAEKIEAFRETFKELQFFQFGAEVTEVDEAYDMIREQDAAVREIEVRRAELAHLATLFECGDLIVAPTELIETTRTELGLVKQFWDCACMVHSYFGEWNDVVWEDINTEEMEDGTKKFKQELRVMAKTIRQEFSAYSGLLQMVNDQLAAVPVVGELRQPCMRDRHWQAIVDITSVEIDIANIPSLKFLDLKKLELHKFVDDVGDIVDSAVKEEKIENNVAMLETNWETLEFEFTPYNDTDISLVKVSEETFETLEDNQVLVQNMASSRFVGQFQEKVLYWQKSLATVAEVIQILSEIQRTWSYLEDLFIHSDEVKKELPEDAERFIGIDEGVKEVLGDCSKTPNLVARCNADGLYTFLEDLQHQLELCEKSLMDFMDAKKRAFPRFYFVSSKDLLDILSNGNRPEKVMEHIPKIFQAIQKLDLKDDVTASGEDVKVALGMYSPQDEYVPFAKQCLLNGKVEGWLHRVIDHMRDALRQILHESNTAYSNMKRTDCIIEYQGQICITTCQTWWCTEVENVFLELGSGSADAMIEYNKRQIDQITDLITCVRTKLTKQDRRKVMNIITLDSHARDIIGALIANKNVRNDCFGWQGQLRYKWDKDAPLADGGKGDCVINICDAEFRYAFEYLGNGARLVITPLTDRLYITATQALHLVLGCAPAGPAGTGKTETTKDLASQMGLAVYVFNCSDQMDYRSVGDIFKGLASSGSWGCFDEFNRIAAEVLSVCSVYYKSILDAIRAGKDTFNFPGDESLVLNKEVGAFITMNPGYLGRTELPEGLKALFRPVTVMVPDLELICENMLMAEGYEEAKILAHKFVILYSLNKDLLSKQMHYDWGLRAIKSVLVVAGSFKREEPDTPEMGLLMRALRDFNVPKIVAEDMVVFMGLISDLFPNLDVPPKQNLELMDMVRDIAKDQKLQPDDNFVLKVCQLEELIEIRHCVFLMGPSGTGKSEVYKTLAKAWNMRGQKTMLKDINPKSISVDELYGVISMATREWKDGLLSCILRDLSRIPDTNPKWLILDGDLDANWIESMNSVMDDNKLLTLASNERIPLLPHMRMLFEIRDLAYATPATVSRAGILFISPSNQWDLYAQSWIDRRDDTPEQKVILRTLIDKYVPATLNYIRVTFKHLVPMLDFNMVQTLCHLLENLYTAENKFVGCTDKMQYELFFCFAAVWAFGGAFSVKDGDDHRLRFNRWWRNEWRPVKYPDVGLVFDYFADAETLRFTHWSEVTKTIEYDPERAMSSVTVPTQETTGMAFWLNAMVARQRPCLMVGYSGCGKTSIIKGILSELDAEQMIHLVINFNYFTDAAILQKVMEQPLEKKAGKNYGPPGTKKLVYFLDDLNMPKVDLYNTQTPIAHIRQHMDYGHWFDRDKLSQKNIGGCQYLAGLNPAAGSFVINPRLQRHFVTFAVGFPNQDSLVTIYSTFLGAHLKDFEASVFERMTKLIGAGLELHQRVSTTFRKTATKFHYEFNVRHLTNMFQGILMAQKEQCKEPWRLVKLWLHEAERTYGDLLMDGNDVTEFMEVKKQVAKKYFPGDPDKDIFPEPNIYTHFSNGLDEKLYGDIPSFEKLLELLTAGLNDYNETFAAMDLVLFEDAMQHVCRISRIVETGHALLVGVGGSGKQSLSRLGAFVAQCTIARITITRTYSAADLKIDLMNMYIKAGQKNEKICFLFTDNQITNENFLVFINDLLASGHIPDLFPPDEKENAINAVRSEVKSAGIIDTNDNCWNFFIDKVVANLHVVLCFSPGEAFRKRSLRFPALVNNCIIDWFHPWPAEALASVSERFLGDIEGGLGTEEHTKAIIDFMPFSFGLVNDMSAKFLERERRFNYNTPKSYLELIALFKSMLNNKRESMMAASDRLQVGLDKLQATAKQVGELEEVLKVKSVEVEEKIAAAEILSEKVGSEKKIVGEEAAAAAIEAEKCGVIKVEVTQKQEDCERDLAAALPAVDKAMAALDSLNKKDLGELKALKKPPSGVDDVMAAVMVLLSPPEGVVKDKSWQAAVKTMKDLGHFLEALASFKIKIDEESVPKANFKAVRTYLKMDTMNVDVILRKSSAAAGLCSWVLNICVYYDIVSDVEPKKRMLAEALAQLEAANTKLAQVQEQVLQLEEKLAALEAEFASVVQEKEETVAMAEKMKMKLSMAQRLIAALASENVRWSEGVGELQAQMHLLPGDCLVSAAFVSYVGSFSTSYRQELINDNFMPYFVDAGIPMSDDPDPVKLIADESTIAQWNTDLLPSDRVSVENGCIMTTCARWPLIIDPQMQGIVWIKEREAKNDLNILRLGKKGMMDAVERAVEGGTPVLIENLEESIDATLGPIVGRQFIKKARRILVKLGEKEVEVHKDFKLVLHTKLSNPHYPPEIQAETTLVNFTVTEAGLEDQLLARVVSKERPDLEEQKAALISQQNQFKIQLKEIEDSLLYQLATAEGDLTENVELIENLEESKRVSTDIAEKAAVAAETEIEINIAREKYRPVASRSSTLFFLLNSLVRIHTLYMYSLAAFVIVFERAIDNTEAEEDLAARLELLIEHITYTVWHWTRRGMFEHHKLLVATQLTLTILSKAEQIDQTEVTALMMGEKHPQPPMLPDNLSAWLNEPSWAALHVLKTLPNFSDIIDDMTRATKPWKQWIEDKEAEKQDLPQKWKEKNGLQKLMIIRALRPDRVPMALEDFVKNELGDRYIQEQPFQMQQVFEESAHNSPMFFLLFPGVNPYADVEACGIANKYTEDNEYAEGFNLRRISMGQGQEAVAEKVIDDFSITGGWVYLDNVHLMSKWISTLERKLEVCAESAHENFRCFMSAEPHPFPHFQWIPQGILESSIKVVNMPPSSLQANLVRAYDQFNQETIDSCRKSSEMRGMLFSLAFFHACVVARHKFGAQGWSRKYGFNFGDLTICGKVLVNYLNNNDFVPWNDIKYIQGEVMYGGHITDPWDRRVCIAYLEEFMAEGCLSEFNLAPKMKAPPVDGDYDFYVDYIAEKTPPENPTLFGLHPNAEIGFLLSTGENVFSTILEITGGGSGGGGGADDVTALVADFLERTPEDFLMHEIEERVEDQNPYVCVILQECVRMNLLLTEIRGSLIELQLGMEGSLNMSDSMDTLLKCLGLNRVAPSWEAKAYPSKKSMSVWFLDLLSRVEQLKGWSDTLITPVSVWITGLFNPMAYITAILQTTARAEQLPLDQMDIFTDVTEELNPALLTVNSEDGMYIHGLFMEGARWDTKKGAITDSLPKELHPEMPVVRVRGVVHGTYEMDGLFVCPIYITTMRGPTFTFKATLKSTDPLNKWIMAGVCLLMNDE